MFKQDKTKRYPVELWSTGEVEADLVEWGPWEGPSVEQRWQQRRATGASAGRWCSRWAMSGGSPELRCQENHGWGRGRDEGNPGWELDGEASSTPLCGKEEISVRTLQTLTRSSSQKFWKELQEKRFQRYQTLTYKWGLAMGLKNKYSQIVEINLPDKKLLSQQGGLITGG